MGKYSIVVPPPVPQPMELKSGDSILGTIITREQYLYIQPTYDRIGIPQLLEAVTEFLNERTLNIDTFVWDNDYSRFEVKTFCGAGKTGGYWDERKRS